MTCGRDQCLRLQFKFLQDRDLITHEDYTAAETEGNSHLATGRCRLVTKGLARIVMPRSAPECAAEQLDRGISFGSHGHYLRRRVQHFAARTLNPTNADLTPPGLAKPLPYSETLCWKAI